LWRAIISSSDSSMEQVVEVVVVVPTNQVCQLNDRGRYDHPLVPLSSSAPAVHTNKTNSYNAYALFIPHFISKSHTIESNKLLESRCGGGIA